MYQFECNHLNKTQSFSLFPRFVDLLSRLLFFWWQKYARKYSKLKNTEITFVRILQILFALQGNWKFSISSAAKKEFLIRRLGEPWWDLRNFTCIKPYHLLGIVLQSFLKQPPKFSNKTQQKSPKQKSTMSLYEDGWISTKQTHLMNRSRLLCRQQADYSDVV